MCWNDNDDNIKYRKCCNSNAYKLQFSIYNSVLMSSVEHIPNTKLVGLDAFVESEYVLFFMIYALTQIN